MRLITIAFDSAERFLRSYTYEGSQSGALFCETRTELAAGEKVLLELWFPGLPRRTVIRAQELDAQPGRGFWAQVDRADESKRDFMLSVAKHELDVSGSPSRAHRRYPADIPAHCRIVEKTAGGGYRRAVADLRTADVGLGGMFLVSESPPAVGSTLEIVITPNGDLTYTLRGVVAWTTRRREPHPGFGVHLSGGKDSSRLRRMLRRAVQAGRISLSEGGA